jgi:hypothetical protein
LTQQEGSKIRPALFWAAHAAPDQSLARLSTRLFPATKSTQSVWAGPSSLALKYVEKWKVCKTNHPCIFTEAFLWMMSGKTRMPAWVWASFIACSINLCV